MADSGSLIIYEISHNPADSIILDAVTIVLTIDYHTKSIQPWQQTMAPDQDGVIGNIPRPQCGP